MTKIQSELEKRLPNKYSFSSETIILTKENLKKVIDEARKDFMEKAKPVKVKGVWAVSEEFTTMDWFKRWFGVND